MPARSVRCIRTFYLVTLAAVFALSLNSGAYISEMIRGGLTAMPGARSRRRGPSGCGVR